MSGAHTEGLQSPDSAVRGQKQSAVQTQARVGDGQAPFLCGTLTPSQAAQQAEASCGGSLMGSMGTAGGAEVTGGAGSSESSARQVQEPEPEPAKPTGLVMQIILRRDLLTTHGWPVGPLLAQAAHASTAVLHLYRDHPDVRRYLEGEDGRGWEVMRKVTYEVPDEAALRGLVGKLDGLKGKGKGKGKGEVGYHLWIEQPENIPTALALVPNKRPKALKAIMDEAGCKLFG